MDNSTLLNPPDNRHLIQLLDVWSKNRSKETYAAVRTELQEGNSFLMLPSGENSSTHTGWNRTTQKTKLQLASIYTIDGVKMLGAFTDADAVLRWSKGKPIPCVSMTSKAVLQLCEKNGFRKIIINSGSDNVYPLSYLLNDEFEKGVTYW